MIEAKILKPGYTQREALVLLFNTDSKLDLLDIDEVYYPYVRLRYLITVGKGRIMKKLNKLCDCIIDRVSGSVYETEGDPEFDYVEIPEDEALEIQTPLNECYDTGHSFALKQYIGKAKLMATPEMQIIEEDIFYKKFYVVKARDPEGYTYFIHGGRRRRRHLCTGSRKAHRRAGQGRTAGRGGTRPGIRGRRPRAAGRDDCGDRGREKGRGRIRITFKNTNVHKIYG